MKAGNGLFNHRIHDLEDQNMAYAYDGLGTNPDNLIVNERHSVQPPSQISDASFIILRAAPFFANSLVLRTGPTSGSTLLVEGVDYLHLLYQKQVHLVVS